MIEIEAVHEVRELMLFSLMAYYVHSRKSQTTISLLYYIALFVDFNSDLYTVHGSHKLHFLETFSLKMGSTVLFTHLKIILLQCFQFSVFSFSKNKFNPNEPIFAKI